MVKLDLARGVQGTRRNQPEGKMRWAKRASFFPSPPLSYCTHFKRNTHDRSSVFACKGVLLWWRNATLFKPYFHNSSDTYLWYCFLSPRQKVTWPDFLHIFCILHAVGVQDLNRGENKASKARLIFPEAPSFSLAMHPRKKIISWSSVFACKGVLLRGERNNSRTISLSEFLKHAC